MAMTCGIDALRRVVYFRAARPVVLAVRLVARQRALIEWVAHVASVTRRALALERAVRVDARPAILARVHLRCTLVYIVLTRVTFVAWEKKKIEFKCL